MQLQPLKHLTIVVEELLKDQITAKAVELGATGYTVTEASGTGSRGSRSVFGGENARIDLICPPAVAEAILSFVSHHYFENYACIAWVTDVEVVRGDHYAKRE